MEIAGKAPDSAWAGRCSAGYRGILRALRIEVERRRPLTAADVNDARKVAVVNETFVRMLLQQPSTREAGATRIELGTSEDDVAARALYESVGFTNREKPGGPVMYFYERDL